MANIKITQNLSDNQDAGAFDFLGNYINIPKLTQSQINALTSVPAGAILYNTTTQKQQIYNGSEWFVRNVFGNIVYVNSLQDLPSAVGNVITLQANTSYIFTKSLDFQGKVLVTSGNTAIRGSSSETCYLTSTGKSNAVPFLTSQYSISIQNITFEGMNYAIDINGIDLNNTALDWIAFNFLNCTRIGKIKNVANFVNFQVAYLESADLEFDGTFGSIVYDSSLLNGRSLATIIKIKSTAIITRRIRFVFSPFIVLSGEVGINIEAGASIPVDSFILDKCNFSGGSANYISGASALDSISDWTGNKGIQNSTSSVNIYFNTTQTATTISTANVYTLANVNWLVGSALQRFLVATNRITYKGAITQNFVVFFNLSLTSSNNNQIFVAIYKNGVLVTGSETITTTNGSGRSENVTISTIINLATDDYVEIYIKNQSSANDITLQIGNGYLITS